METQNYQTKKQNNRVQEIGDTKQGIKQVVKYYVH